MQGSPRHGLHEVMTYVDAGYLGVTEVFTDIAKYFAPTDAAASYAPWCRARWVINKSGTTLARGRRVLHHTNATYIPGVAVGGLAGADVVFAGFVCPFIPASGVPDGAAFWLIVEGFTKVSYNGSANLAVGDTLSGAATGHVDEAIGTYKDPWVIGISQVAKTSGSAGDLIAAFVKLPF